MKSRSSITTTAELGSILASLQASLNSGRYSSKEVARLSADISTSRRRLLSREYRQTSFKPRNQLTIPDRTEEFYMDLRFFWSIGKVWERLLRRMKLGARSRILDIGPGFFPKVEIGLCYLGFEGSVDLLDVDPMASPYATMFLDFFAKPFSTSSITGAVSGLKPSVYDLITANHFLDDFLLSHYCLRSGIRLHDAYGSEQIFKSAWRHIMHDHRAVDDQLGELIDALHRVSVRGTNVVLVDYPSFSHKALGLTSISTFVHGVGQRLSRSLCARGFRSRRLISHPIICDRLTIEPKHVLSFVREDER